MYFKVRATCITADTPVCTSVRKNSRYIKFVSLAWKIHVCILRWLDTVSQGQYLPSLSINYVAINQFFEKLPPQLY